MGLQRPPKHSHWRPDDWPFYFSGCNYEPGQTTVSFFFSGCNYEYYRGPDDCTFFFSGHNFEPAETSELVEPPQPFSLTARWLSFFSGRNYAPARRLYFFFSGRNYHSYRWPDDSTLFFSGCNYEPQKYPSSWNPPNHSHWRPDNWAFFSRRNYAPAKWLYLFYFQVVIFIPTEGQTTVCFFFSGCNYEPAKTSELVEPPQTFPLLARRLSLFFRTYLCTRQTTVPFFLSQMTGPFFSGHNSVPAIK